jgi:uncharacterized protein (DUF983 family)
LTDYEKFNTPVSPIKAGLGCKCPKCGKGKLYDGFLEFAKKCSVCGLDYSDFDSGDGPAVFIILILGFFTVGMALFVEVNFQPPLWLHAIIWAPIIIGGSIGMLRPAKGLIIAMQYLYNAREGKLDQ